MTPLEMQAQLKVAGQQYRLELAALNQSPYGASERAALAAKLKDAMVTQIAHAAICLAAWLTKGRVKV